MQRLQIPKLKRAYELHCFDVPPANSFKLVRTTFLRASDFTQSLNLKHSGRDFVFSMCLGIYLSIYLLVPHTKVILF